MPTEEIPQSTTAASWPAASDCPSLDVASPRMETAYVKTNRLIPPVGKAFKQQAQAQAQLYHQLSCPRDPRQQCRPSPNYI